jgi:single-stranded DNA-binding protein
MAQWLLVIGKDKFRVVAFGNVAEAVLRRCGDGDLISLTGTASINNWKDNEGRWHNDFQATAWSIEIDGEKISYKKAEGTTPRKSQHQAPAGRSKRPGDEYAYTGGPF